MKKTILTVATLFIIAAAFGQQTKSTNAITFWVSDLDRIIYVSNYNFSYPEHRYPEFYALDIKKAFGRALEQMALIDVSRGKIFINFDTNIERNTNQMEAWLIKKKKDGFTFYPKFPFSWRPIN